MRFYLKQANTEDGWCGGNKMSAGEMTTSQGDTGSGVERESMCKRYGNYKV